MITGRGFLLESLSRLTLSHAMLSCVLLFIGRTSAVSGNVVGFHLVLQESVHRPMEIFSLLVLVRKILWSWVTGRGSGN